MYLISFMDTRNYFYTAATSVHTIHSEIVYGVGLFSLSAQ